MKATHPTVKTSKAMSKAIQAAVAPSMRTNSVTSTMERLASVNEGVKRMVSLP